MSSKFGRIQPWTAELASLTNLKNLLLENLFLAHLSRRLIGELIVYPWSGVRRRRRPQCSNISFSETAWPIKAKFYVEPPWVGGTKFCSRHLGHMTKMAATPIYAGFSLTFVFQESLGLSTVVFESPGANFKSPK